MSDKQIESWESKIPANSLSQYKNTVRQKKLEIFKKMSENLVFQVNNFRYEVRGQPIGIIPPCEIKVIKENSRIIVNTIQPQGVLSFVLRAKSEAEQVNGFDVEINDEDSNIRLTCTFMDQMQREQFFQHFERVKVHTLQDVSSDSSADSAKLSMDI